MYLFRPFLVIVCFVFCLPLAAQALAAEPVFASVSPRIPDQARSEPAAGMFLVARRSLQDPNFRESVIYIVQHDDEGTLGLVLNRPGKIMLSEAVPDVDTRNGRHHPLYLGGPVGIPQITMLIANPPETPMAKHIAGNIYFSADRALLDHLLDEGKPDSELRFYLGYAGWTPGQLAFELMLESWHMIRAEDTNTVFDDNTGTLWERLIQSLEPTGIHVRYRRFDTHTDTLPARAPQIPARKTQKI